MLCAISDTSVRAAGMKLEVQLLWGTNQDKSPNPKHKEVEPAVKEKLNKLPLKWSNYFLVNSKQASLGSGESKSIELSEKCSIDIKNLDRSTVEISLYGNRKQVMTSSQALPKGEILILGGNAPNETSWLVVLKRID